MRVLVLRLRVLRARLHWVYVGLGVASKVADLFGMAWLVTLLNAFILALLILVVLIDVIVRALVRHLHNLWKVLLSASVNAGDLIRQLLKLHFLVLALLLSHSEQHVGLNPYIDFCITTKRMAN